MNTQPAAEHLASLEPIDKIAASLSALQGTGETLAKALEKFSIAGPAQQQLEQHGGWFE